MNCPDFELLSAHADGETTPSEATMVEQHARHCPTCARHLANLGLVSQAVRQPRPLPADFNLRVQVPSRPSWWRKLHELMDSPVVHLVGAQRRRRARFGTAEMVKMMALFALPVLFMCLSSDRSPLTAFLLVSALGLMVGLPLRQFSEEVALLAGLRRGRCLEEIMSSGTSAQGLLDGLALQGLMQIGRAALTVWPVLLLGTLAIPEHGRLRAWELEAAWLPGVLGMFLAGYYLAQLLQVQPGGWLRRGLLLLFVLSPWTLALLGLPGCLLASALTALVARGLAIQGLQNPQRPRAIPVHRRNPLVRAWSQNPIARREMSRLAGGVGGNWHRLLIWRASMAVLPVAWVLHAISVSASRWQSVYPIGILLFAALFFARAALRTLPSVVRERESQSWEILMQTPLGTTTFVNGWLQICLYTVFTEGFFALLALLGYLLSAAPAADLPGSLLYLLVLPVAALLGAYFGLGLSAASRTYRGASQSFFLWSLAGVLGWMLTLGLGEGLQTLHTQRLLAYASYANVEVNGAGGPLETHALLALLPIGLLLWARARLWLRKLPSIDPGEADENSLTGRYSPILACLDLGALLALGYALVAWEALAREADLSAFKGATLLLVGALGWLLAGRLPLATLAEISLGRPLSLLLGCLFGVGLGWSATLASSAWHFLDDRWHNDGEVEFGLFLLATVVGAALGGLARRARPAQAKRHAVLAARLRYSCALPALAGAGLWLGSRYVAVPEPGPEFRQPDTTRYVSQLFRLQELRLDGYDITLINEKPDSFPTQDSPGVWWSFALRHENAPELGQLISLLPEFGGAGQADRRYPGSNFRRNLPLLRTVASLEESRRHWQKALSAYRWCLLCQDSLPHRQSDFDYFGDEEREWLLEGIVRIAGSAPLQPTQTRALIEQLQDHSCAARQLRLDLHNYLAVVPLQPDTSLRRLLPVAYFQRENSATLLGLTRAIQMAGDFQLRELSRQSGLDLLSDVAVCPLARRQVSEVCLKAGVQRLAKYWSRREGTALFLAIQLYRQDHHGEWPPGLEQVQAYLPRPARCYLNESGSFDYTPGGHLSCRRDDGTEPMVIYQEGKR